ncbi:MAG: hypothetical protein KF809_13185 [Chloroflexi bacterium]|nr:hypothetical protein [Chloroflexota bacterium]
MMGVPDYQIILAMAPRPEGLRSPAREPRPVTPKPTEAPRSLAARIRAFRRRTTLGPIGA